MKRRDHYKNWDGTCSRCGHSYFNCRGNCTCLACNAQRQSESKQGLWFDEDEKHADADERQQFEAMRDTGQPARVESATEMVLRVAAMPRWSQERIARELGVSYSTVNHWATGKFQPSPTLRKALEKLFMRAHGH